MGNRKVVLSSKNRYSNAREVGDTPTRNDEIPQYSRDILQQMSDRDLSNAENSLERRIFFLRKESSSTYGHEVELCYVQDEIGRRSRMSGSYKRKS